MNELEKQKEIRKEISRKWEELGFNKKTSEREKAMQELFERVSSGIDSPDNSDDELITFPIIRKIR